MPCPIYSIKNEATFALINKRGRKYRTPYFILIYQKNFSNSKMISPSFLLAGMKVSKKLGTAVVRNKIKRRIRHLIRLISVYLKPNKYALIMIPARGFEKTQFALLFDELKKIMATELVNMP